MAIAAVVLAVGVDAAAQIGRAARAFPQEPSEGVVTPPTQRAVFAVFAASSCVPGPCTAGQLDTAISVSNTLAGPPGVTEAFNSLPNREGTVELYLWDTYGHLLFYETQAGSPGFGLSAQPGREGFLAPGATWRVLLSEILDRVDYAGHEIEFDHQDGVYAGYMWIISNFDGIQGTTNLTDFATFTQTLVLQPDLGSTFFDFDANAGVPISPPQGP